MKNAVHLRSLLFGFGASVACFSALAGPVLSPLNTFPAAGAPDGGDAGLFAAAHDAQAIALPFSVAAPGYITSVETGIQLNRTQFCGWRLGIIEQGALNGSTMQPGFSDSLWTSYTDIAVRSLDPQLCGDDDVLIFDNGAYVALENLNWFLEQGSYYLLAAWRSDQEFASWHTNASLLSDDWAVQVVGGGTVSSRFYPCGGSGSNAPWTTLSDCGIDPLPTPAARIDFEPGLRVPEPGTLSLVIAALGAAAFTVRWRDRHASPRS